MGTDCGGPCAAEAAAVLGQWCRDALLFAQAECRSCFDSTQSFQLNYRGSLSTNYIHFGTLIVLPFCWLLSLHSYLSGVDVHLPY